MERLGVYIHFPFCLKKCPYCDFVSVPRERSEIDHRGYASAVLTELERRASAFDGRRLDTIFFGGGTPSLWDPKELGRVLSGIRSHSRERSEDVEITVECNPSSLDEDRARALLDVGVNRLSIGVQGLDEARLQFLGRLHDPEGGLAAVHAALRAGAPRVSADYIYGVALDNRPPSLAEAAAEIRRLVETGIDHLSAYSLTIEPGTPFGARARRGTLPIAEDDSLAELFFGVEETLESLGFEHYEISNYGRPGAAARHNLNYWRGGDYLGLGCAAVGTLAEAGGSARRYRNSPAPERYTRSVATGESTEEEVEMLDPETRLRERIMLGLRMSEGLDLSEAGAALGVPGWTAARQKAADKLVASGRLSVVGKRATVPRRGRIYTDGTASALF